MQLRDDIVESAMKTFAKIPIDTTKIHWNKLLMKITEGLASLGIARDIEDMPGWNPETSGAGGSPSRSVSTGEVIFSIIDAKPICKKHKAMNAVNLDRSIWRCLMCNVGVYYEDP